MELTKKVDENLRGRLELQEDLLNAIHEVCLALYADHLDSAGIVLLGAAIDLRDKRSHVADGKGCV
jgi:hypothetical protein